MDITEIINGLEAQIEKLKLQNKKLRLELKLANEKIKSLERLQNNNIYVDDKGNLQNFE